MKPIGPLMIEHRLIERMIRLLEGETTHIERTKEIRPIFIDSAVDFIRTYADRTHHGKEEDILFRDLAKKNLSEDDKALMEELIEDHKRGRQIVAELVEAKERFLEAQEEQAVVAVFDRLSEIARFYPTHIKKEDKVFFPASMSYFSNEEQKVMLDECWQFDRKMIHEKYKSVVERFEVSRK